MRAGFAARTVAIPILGVSGTALAAQLAPGEKGEALRLFNAVCSLAGALGALLGGWWTEAFGYGTVCLVGAVVVALAALLSDDRRAEGRAATGPTADLTPPATR